LLVFFSQFACSALAPAALRLKKQIRYKQGALERQYGGPAALSG
jgi:hypothetical protein